MNGKYKFSWNQSKLSKLRGNIKQAMIAAGFATANKAAENAPVDTGALSNSLRVTTSEKDAVYVLAGGKSGGKSIAYARRREYENRKNPQTKRYMGRAFDDLKTNYAKYFKGVTK